MLKKQAVSEAIGALVLVGVVVIGVGLVWVLLFSAPPPTKVPVLNTIISNRSQGIYLLHKGGDPLRAGEFQILVDGGDQTGNFTLQGSGTEPWSVGETLAGTSPSMPKRVVIVFSQSGGGPVVLGIQDFIGSVTLQLDPGAGWYLHPIPGENAWPYRKKITIHPTGTADQSNFPVLISYTDPDLTTKALGTGNDILFTSSDGETKLNHEIENFTAATGEIVTWVSVPALSSSAETVLYMFYGNPSAPSQQNPEGVWDSDFMAVWHHDTVFTDSTSNNNDGANTGSTDAVGKIAHGRNYPEANSWVQMPAAASINNLFAGGGTFSAWIYPRDRGEGNPDGGRIGDKSSSYVGATGWGFGTYTGINLSFRKGFSTTAGFWCSPTGSIPASTWSYVTVTYDNTSAANNPTFYINGVPSSTVRMTAPVGNPTSDTANVMRTGSSAAGNQRDFDGIIDEIRASDEIRSSSWIATEYANQNDPSSFYTIGSEEQFT